MHARTTRDRLFAALVDADYPATKDDLLATAQRNGADEETIRAIRSIPPVDYRSRDEVLRAVPLVTEPPEETERLRAVRHRAHTHPGLADGSKDISDV
jgi:hypothetical protein